MKIEIRRKPIEVDGAKSLFLSQKLEALSFTPGSAVETLLAHAASELVS
ncbi:hypothetical protein [Altererythrobacter sp.]